MPDDPLVGHLKHQPHQRSTPSRVLPAASDPSLRRDGDGLPIPPDELVVGYADSASVYLESGALHVRTMLAKLAEGGCSLAAGGRILDFGSGVGRMIRHLGDHAVSGEVWGVDISAPHVHWCESNLSPPFHFATTTTIPHLPFRDGYFDLIYAASVFTHLADLANAWILELRRVCRTGGFVYLTIHDDSTLELFEGLYAEHWLARMVQEDPSYRANAGNFGMLVIGNDVEAQVFYGRDTFRRALSVAFEVRGVHPQAHGYQTAYVARAKPD